MSGCPLAEKSDLVVSVAENKTFSASSTTDVQSLANYAVESASIRIFERNNAIRYGNKTDLYY